MQWKSTGHGICAAVGKAGAIIGSFGFLYAAQPSRYETTWSYPCTYYTDTYHPTQAQFDAGFQKAGCVRKNNCPGGYSVSKANSAVVPTLCDTCNPLLLSGCFNFGIGVQGALGILAAINFCGLLTSFLIPETMGKSLEELNGEAVSRKVVEVGKEKEGEMVGVPAESYA